MSDFFNRTLDTMREGPLGPAVRWIEEHPRLSAWIALALGMVILVIIEAQDAGLTAGSWVAIIIATILTAGACVWIISWEDEDEEPEVMADGSKANAAAAGMPAGEEMAQTGAAKPAARKSTARKSSTKSGKKTR